MILIDAAVAQHQDVGAFPIGPVTADAQLLDRFLQGGVAVVEHTDRLAMEMFIVKRFDLHHVRSRQDRIGDFKHGAVGAFPRQQVALRAEIHRRIGDHLFPDRVDRRIGDLCEALIKVTEEIVMLFGEHRQRNIAAHRSGRLNAVLRHRKKNLPDILIGIAECLVELVPDFLGIVRQAVVGDLQPRKRPQMQAQPFPVRARLHIFLLAFTVFDDPSLHGIRKQDLPRHQPGLPDDMLFRNIQHADFGGEDQLSLIGDIVARRPQAIAVKTGPYHIAVGKQQGGRSVPGFHHRRIVVIEILLLLTHRIIVLPRFGNHDH